MTAKPVRLAIIGCGDHAYDVLAGQLRWAPENVLVAIADVRQDRLDRFSQFYRVENRYLDYRTMLADETLDAVILSVGEREHPAIAEAAMRAGCHVFVEKSPCVTQAEALHLARVQEETGRWTMVGWQRRFMPAYTMAREITQRAEFGRILMWQSQFNAAPYRDEHYFLVNHVIHHLDLARFFMGEIELTHVQRVFLNPRMVGYTMSIRSEDGGVGTIQAGAFLDHSISPERTEILGERRSLIVENFRHLRYNRPSNGPRGGSAEPFGLTDDGDALVWDQSFRFDPRTTYRGFEDEIRYFVGCVAEGRWPSPDIADTARTMRLFDQLIEQGMGPAPTGA